MGESDAPHIFKSVEFEKDLGVTFVRNLKIKTTIIFWAYTEQFDRLLNICILYLENPSMRMRNVFQTP